MDTVVVVHLVELQMIDLRAVDSEEADLEVEDFANILAHLGCCNRYDILQHNFQELSRFFLHNLV
ncbi:MAG: hypothetical protein WC489_06680 [Patescibacteria group bacterium]